MKLMRKCFQPSMRYLGFAASVRIYRYPSEAIGMMSPDDIKVLRRACSVNDNFFARFCGQNHDLAESRENFDFGLGTTKKDSAVNSRALQGPSKMRSCARSAASEIIIRMSCLASTT